MTRSSRSLLVAATATTLLAAGLAAGVGPAQANHAHPPGPIHAGNTYGWGHPAIDHRFVGPLNRKAWHVEGTGSAHTKNGLLDIDSARRGSTTVTLTWAGHRVGRWETRMLSKQSGRAGSRYHVVARLIPAGNLPRHCGAQDIALADYLPGGRGPSHYIRNLPDRSFVAEKRLNVHNDQWHTYAVEVTKTHISWFVDAHVISTERRPAALSGVPLTFQYALVAEDGTRMKRTRMQMDWLRYWTLKNKNKKSIKAPRPEAGTYADAC